ncbi:ubiquitin carboxyl-terminal hydrolase 16-like isoform X2 [Cucurbita maxima]|uniref:ubiquitinyl hydrolase 1 n=1 Tax=Cucurbita maxima TaxID=3661 RepID=A0A6J1KPF4_CUCMA|nr:ubiquitin carboxyl-terminal hydrolase 16-like isoform X2 [Cucurbita maxima]
MLVVGDLGFQILVLAACLVFPVFGIVLRRKWRLGMARTEEINRLLVLASEEAARVEIEASFGCTAAPISLNLHCAVCLSPTTTRCARCKAVRYCSGKCQIIHWRQGHKTECHPPKTSDWSLEKENDYGDRIANQHHSISYDNKFGIENGQRIEPDEVLYGKLTLPSSDDSGSSPIRKNVSVELHADEEENSTTEFVDATLNTELSDDASRSENSSESCSPRSDGYLSAQNSFDKDDSTSRLSIVDPNKPLSPNYAHLVNSVDKFAKRKTENHPAFVGIDPVYDNHSRAAEVRSIDGSCEAASSSFQENNGYSIGLKDDVHDVSVPFSINGAKNKKIPGSHSFLHFSFSVSGGTPSDAQVAQVNENVADGSLRTTSGINRTAGSNLQSDINIDSSEVRNSPSSCEGSGDKDNTAKELADHPVVYSMISSSPRISPFPAVSKCESRSVRDSNTSMSAPLKSERSCPVFIQPDNSKIVSKHSGNGSLVNHSSVHLPTISSRESVPPTDSRKVGPTQVGAGVSSLDANFSLKSAYGFRPFALNEIKSKSDHSYVVNDSENAGKYNDKGHFSFELLVDLYNWNKVELQPSGLVNCGNSCYANVVLQCLIFTPPLTAYFLQGLHSKACAKERWCFTCEFESLILEAKEGKSPLSPFRIISQLRKIGSQLVNGKEEDAHEFLRCAIDTMQSTCSMEAQVSRSGPMEEETTLIGFTFGGYLLSKIKCTRCESKSERIERILDLTVEISGDIETIEEALQQYTSIEILDGDNRYQCGRCKSYVKANKRLSILEAPNILTIALKRFQSGKFGKLNKPVIFSEILDLAPYMSSRSDKTSEYRLYGVIVHLDVMNAAFSGHYVCYIRNNQNKWFKIDDSTVTAVEFENVLTRGAYMLFYARCSPRVPRLIRSKIMTDSKEGCIPALISGRSTSFKPSPNSTYPDSQNPHIYNNSSNDSSNISSFYRKFHQLQKLLEDDLTSDSSSLLSSNSDESSCSTNSSSDSTSTEDLPEYIYSDSGCGWNSLQNRSDTNTSLPSASSSSSSQPLYPAESSQDAPVSSSSSPLLHPAESSQDAPVRAKTTESRPARPYQTNGISNLSSRRESTCREKAMHLMEDKKNGWR